MKININKLSDAWVLKDFKYWKKVTGKIPKTEKEAQQIIKSLHIKEKIVEALQGRKQKEEDIISLFFGKGETRKEQQKKHKELYKSIIKNLSIMDEKKLNDIHKGVINTGNHLL